MCYYHSIAISPSNRARLRTISRRVYSVGIPIEFMAIAYLEPFRLLLITRYLRTITTTHLSRCHHLKGHGLAILHALDLKEPEHNLRMRSQPFEERESLIGQGYGRLWCLRRPLRVPPPVCRRHEFVKVQPGTRAEPRVEQGERLPGAGVQVAIHVGPRH